MSWVKLDDHFPEHDRVSDLTDKSFRLHVTALCYCARNLTDGVMSDKAVKVVHAVAGITGGRWTAELVAAELWVPAGDGYAIRDYLDYNPDAVTVKRQRKDRSDAGKRGASARWQGKEDGKSHGNGDGNGHSKRHGEPDMANEWQPGKAPSRPLPKDRENPDGFSQIVDFWLSESPPLIKHRESIRLSQKAQRVVAKALRAYGRRDVCSAIHNYASVIGSPAHYFSHKWTLPDFLTRGIHTFVDEAEPLENYRIKTVPTTKDRGMTFQEILNGGEDDGPRAIPFRSVA